MVALFIYAVLVIGLSAEHLLPTIPKHGETLAIGAHLIIWGIFISLYWRWSAYRIRGVTEELKPLVEQLKRFSGKAEPQAGSETLFDLLDVLGNIIVGDFAGLAQFGLEKILESLQGAGKTDEQRNLEQKIACLLQSLEEQRSRFRMVALLTATVSAGTLLMTLT